MAFTAPRKTIVLPQCQESVVVRKLGPADFRQGAKVPDMLHSVRRRKALGELTEKQAAEEMQDDETQTYLAELALCAQVPPAGAMRIVYKKPEDPAFDDTKEISFFDLTPEDQRYLVDETWLFTGEGAAKAATFSEQA